MCKVLLEESLIGFEKYLVNDEKSYNTIRNYKKDISRFIEWIGEIEDVEDITKEMSLAYKEDLEASYKYSTVNRHLASFNSFVNYLGKSELKLKLIKIQSHFNLDNELSPEDVNRMTLAALELRKTKIALIIQVIASTGIRISELKTVTFEAVNRGAAEIKSKGSVRTIIFSKNLILTLKKFCEKNDINSGVIFRNKNTNSILSRQWISTEMKAIANYINIDCNKVFPHNLRHFFARSFINHGFSLIDLADVLGHKSLETTRIYTRTSVSYKRKQMNQLAKDGWTMFSKTI